MLPLRAECELQQDMYIDESLSAFFKVIKQADQRDD